MCATGFASVVYEIVKVRPGRDTSRPTIDGITKRCRNAVHMTVDMRVYS